MMTPSERLDSQPERLTRDCTLRICSSSRRFEDNNHCSAFSPSEPRRDLDDGVRPAPWQDVEKHPARRLDGAPLA